MIITEEQLENPSKDDRANAASVYSEAKKLLTVGRFADSAALFRLMLQLTPADERGWLGLGLSHEQLGQLNVARELYAVGSVVGSSAKCHLAGARVLCKQHLIKLAVEQYEHAAKLAEEQDDERLAALARAELEVCHGLN